MSGVIRTPCPDCNGQIHLESYLGDGENYAKYICIGDKNYPIGTDGIKSKGSGCGFLVNKKMDEDGNIKSKRINSDSINSLEEWYEYDEKHKQD